MSNDKMREEFEAKFPLPAGVAWKESIGMYEVVDIWKLDQTITIGKYNWLWEGWQASREALVIELPDDDYLNRESVFVQGYIEGVRLTKEAIEAAGVKVKP